MRLGPYEVLAELGRGGAGVVFRARAPGGDEVAVKLLGRQGSPAALARFAREVRLQQALGAEDGFVPLLDAGEERGAPYLVMPFLPGGTLRQRLERGPLGLRDATELAQRLAQALSRAHARGVVHRDLKPENILFAADGRPFVADLGLAKHFDHGTPGASQSVALSTAGQMRGTAGYMAPEQLRDASSVQAPADVFALGAILHECLAGAPAFEGQSVAELLRRLEACEVPRLRLLRPDTPAWLEEVVQRALARDPARRFPDGEALARALADGPRLEARARRAGRLRRRVALALGAGVAVAAAAFAVSLGRADPVTTDLPRACAGFARTRTARLVSVAGRYERSHAGAVTALAFSPRGDVLASGSEDRTARLWDAATGRELACFTCEEAVHALAWRADGAWLVTIDRLGALRAWDVASGQVVRRATVGAGPKQAAFARGNTLVCLAPEPTLVDLDGGQQRPCPAPPEARHALSLSADGSRAAGTRSDGRFAVWDTATGRLLRTLEGKLNMVIPPPVLSPDGTRLVEHVLRGLVLHEVDGDASAALELPPIVTPAAISPDGAWLLVVAPREGVTLRPLDREGTPVTLGSEETAQMGGLCFSPDAGRVAWWAGPRVRCRDLGAAPASPPEPSLSPPLALSRDERLLAASGDDRSIQVREVESGRLLRALPHPRADVTCLVFTGERELLSLGDDGALVRWDLSRGVELRREEVKGPYSAAAISPDGAVLALGGANGAVARDLRTGHQTRLGPLWVQAVGSDGLRVQACGVAGEVRELELATGARRSTATLPRVTAAAFLAGGAGALVAERQVALSDLRGGVSPLGEHPEAVYVLAVSADGGRALSASLDGTVVLWDLRPPRRELDRFSLASAGDRVKAAAWLERGFLLLTARGVLLRYALDP